MPAYPKPEGLNPSLCLNISLLSFETHTASVTSAWGVRLRSRTSSLLVVAVPNSTPAPQYLNLNTVLQSLSLLQSILFLPLSLFPPLSSLHLFLLALLFRFRQFCSFSFLLISSSLFSPNSPLLQFSSSVSLLILTLTRKHIKFLFYLPSLSSNTIKHAHTNHLFDTFLGHH